MNEKVAQEYAKALKKGMEKLEAEKKVHTNHIALQKKLIAESKKKAKKRERTRRKQDTRNSAGRQVYPSETWN